MDRLLLYHDFVSPFCRLAHQLVPEAARRNGLAVRSVPFELCPPPAPLPEPEELFGEELEVARTLADEWGMELGALPRLPRTRKAHEAVAFARREGAGAEVVTAIYRALWADGRDISRLDVLAEIGDAAGLDGQALHVALGLDELASEVVREQEAASAAGLTGVPAVQVRDVRAVGLFPIDELTDWIRANR